MGAGPFEELKSELQVLKQKFDFEQQNIQNYYTKEIERLKEARRMEVKSLKKPSLKSEEYY